MRNWSAQATSSGFDTQKKRNKNSPTHVPLPQKFFLKPQPTKKAPKIPILKIRHFFAIDKHNLHLRYGTSLPKKSHIFIYLLNTTYKELLTSKQTGRNCSPEAGELRKAVRGMNKLPSCFYPFAQGHHPVIQTSADRLQVISFVKLCFHLQAFFYLYFRKLRPTP